MPATRDNPLELHRVVRELVTLSALPATWRDTPTARIPEKLADALLKSIRATFVFFRLKLDVVGGDLEGVRGCDGSDRTEALRVAISSYVGRGDQTLPPVLPRHVAQDPALRIAVQRVGPDLDLGLLVAASERPDFPTESDRLLLQAGANQLAGILQQRQAEASLKEDDEHLRLALAAAARLTRSKNEFIATASNELQWAAAIVEHSNDAIIGKTLDEIVTSWNPGAERLYGYAAEEMIGRPIRVLAPPERVKEPADILARIKRGEAIHHYDTERVTKTGRRLDVSLTVSPIRDVNGALVGASVVARDIGDRKRAERTLHALLDAAPDATVIVDASGGIVMVNAQVKPLLGYARDELIGRPVDLFVPDGLRRGHAAHRGDYMRHARVRRMGAGLELCALRKDGSEVPVEISLSPLNTEEGAFVVAAIRDVSARRRSSEDLRLSEEALRQAQVNLAHISRVATFGELATSIAHEVNQPLAAIVNDGAACLRWLQSHPPALDDARESVRHMIADANRASHVIARIRTLLARKPSVKVPFGPNQLVQDTAALMQSEFARFDLVLGLELASPLPDVVGDRVQVQQVLINLMVNAIDAMSGIDDRPRELEVRSARGGSTVLLAVRDSGVGIAPEVQDRIFEPFYTTKTDGLGMGLAISRSIVEEHGGHLWAVAREGPGATVQFTIPIAHQET